MLSIYPAIHTIVAVLNWIIMYTNTHSCNNLTPQFLIQYKHTQSESTQGWFSWLFINRYILYIFVNCWYQKGHLYICMIMHMAILALVACCYHGILSSPSVQVKVQVIRWTTRYCNSGDTKHIQNDLQGWQS